MGQKLYNSKTCRLAVMIALTGTFFLVELITGHITNSLALIGDSYHMLSDVISLIVGLCAVRISKWDSESNTFGWARAEVIGALTNSVFLLALCFTILLEAFERLYEVEPIEQPTLLLIVGAVGLGINIIGLALFAGHGHSHGGHGHSHSSGSDDSGHGHSHDTPTRDHHNRDAPPPAAPHLAPGDDTTLPHLEQEHSHTSVKIQNNHTSEHTLDMHQHAIKTDHNLEHNRNFGSSESTSSSSSSKSAAQLNMRGVFLHVLGDALGSVVVIVSAIAIKYGDDSWSYYIDPVMSIVLVIIICCSSAPLLKESGMMLMQTVPRHISVEQMKTQLMQITGVCAVHEFHVWQLAGSRIIASAHIRCLGGMNMEEYTRVAADVKEFFHKSGIHSTTIQMEYDTQCDPRKIPQDTTTHHDVGGVLSDIRFTLVRAEDRSSCVLECGPEKNCYTSTCCGVRKRKPRNRSKSAESNTTIQPIEGTMGDTCLNRRATHAADNGRSIEVESDNTSLSMLSTSPTVTQYNNTDHPLHTSSASQCEASAQSSSSSSSNSSAAKNSSSSNCGALLMNKTHNTAHPYEESSMQHGYAASTCEQHILTCTMQDAASAYHTNTAYVPDQQPAHFGAATTMDHAHENFVIAKF